MAMSKLALDLRQMSMDERLDLLEDLWESMNRTPDDVPLTDAQRLDLDRRLDDLDRDGPVGIPWEDVLRKIKGGPV